MTNTALNTTTSTSLQLYYRQNIGPSSYASILGYSNFETAEDLKEKIENGVYKQEDNGPAIQMGISKEPVVLRLYENLRSVKVKNANWVRNGRLLAKGDGLIGKDGGLEIKCHYGKEHPLSSVPLYHLVQVLGYLHLYKREWWDLMSCCFSESGELGKYRIHRVIWDNHKKTWETFWYPQIVDFIKEIKWKQIEPNPQRISKVVAPTTGSLGGLSVSLVSGATRRACFATKETDTQPVLEDNHNSNVNTDEEKAISAFSVYSKSQSQVDPPLQPSQPSVCSIPARQVRSRPTMVTNSSFKKQPRLKIVKNTTKWYI